MSENCVWNAPQFLTKWHSLSNLEGFRGNDKLRHLFTVILNVKDADWTHYLVQLTAHKEKGLAPNGIHEMYHCMNSEVKEDDWRSVR